MPDWILPAVGFGAAMAVSLLGRTWLMRRWLADGMTARRAAAWSTAITYLPLLVLVGAWNLFSGSPFEPINLVIVLAVLSLPILYGFGLRYAIFDFAEKYGVREHERRRSEGARDKRKNQAHQNESADGR